MNTNKTSLENENQPSCLGAVSSCFCVVDEETGYYESIHRTLESAEKEIADWKRFKPSKDVRIVERELH
jgi:hypothetical protein